MMTETGIIVIDVPEGTSPEESSRLLNAPGESYFLVQVLPVYGGHRAYLRRYKQAPAKTASATNQVDEVTALSILRANRDKPIRTIESLLQAAGCKRGRRWVCDQLDATCAEDGLEDKAIALLKQTCAEWPVSEQVDYLRYAKVKRSAAWVRRKREELAKAVPRDNS